MLLFLTRYSEETKGLGRVGDLLSGMRIVTGDTDFESFDAANWEDWLVDVETVLKASENEDTWEQFVDAHLVFKLITPDGTERRFKLGGDPDYHTEALSLDDPVQRQLLQQTADDPVNLVANYNDGVDLYERTLSDGTQIWVHVKDGSILKGGRTPTTL
ncbi:MAG: hypothetical protein M3441_13470 [Chloroflexota bacterium]|nr:hypothetical protein [Chloroflexota bacterium]